MKDLNYLTIIVCIKVLEVLCIDGVPEIIVEVYKDPGDRDLKCRDEYQAIIVQNQTFKVNIKSEKDIYNPGCVIDPNKPLANFEEVRQPAEYKFISKNRAEARHTAKEDPTNMTVEEENCTCTMYAEKCDMRNSVCYLPSNNYSNAAAEIKCTFSIQVKNAPPLVPNANGSMEVNGMPIIEITATTNTTIKSTFYYEEQNKQSTFTCKSDNKKRYIQMKYFPYDGPNQFTEYQKTNILSWYMKLTPQNHNDILECHIADLALANVRVFSVTLSYRSIQEHNIYEGFEVNGLSLAPEKKNGLLYSYIYKCKDGEELSIVPVFESDNYTCRYDGQLKSMMKGRENNVKGVQKIKYVSEPGGSLLTCRITYSKNNQITSLIRILQLSNYDEDFGIIGLSYSKILISYDIQKNNHTNTKTHRTVYEYDNKTPLTCSNGFWMYGDRSEVICPEAYKKNNIKPKICTFNVVKESATVSCNTHTLVLNKTMNNEESRGNTPSLTTRQHPPIILKNSTKPTTTSRPYIYKNTTNLFLLNYKNRTITPSTIKNDHTGLRNIGQQNYDPPKTMIQEVDDNAKVAPDLMRSGKVNESTLIYLGIFIFVVCLVSTLAFLHLHRRKKLRKSGASNTSILQYSNLQKNHDDPMPPPNQWDEERLNSLYAKPIPNRKRKEVNPVCGNHPIYAEPNATNKQHPCFQEETVNTYSKTYANLEEKTSDYKNLAVPYVTTKTAAKDQDVYAACTSENSDYTYLAGRSERNYAVCDSNDTDRASVYGNNYINCENPGGKYANVSGPETRDDSPYCEPFVHRS